jgi:hypothetical protein
MSFRSLAVIGLVLFGSYKIADSFGLINYSKIKNQQPNIETKYQNLLGVNQSSEPVPLNVVLDPVTSKPVEYVAIQ